MKLNLQPKKEKTQQFIIQLPASLHTRLHNLREKATEHGVDFRGAIIDTLEQFVSEAEEKLQDAPKPESKSSRKRVDNNVNGNISPERENNYTGQGS